MKDRLAARGEVGSLVGDETADLATMLSGRMGEVGGLEVPEGEGGKLGEGGRPALMGGLARGLVRAVGDFGGTVPGGTTRLFRERERGEGLRSDSRDEADVWETLAR